MFSMDDLEKIKQKISQLKISMENYDEKGGDNQSRDKCTKENNCLSLDPSALLIIAGILGGVLEVTSIIFHRDQSVDVVLGGTLQRRHKNQLEQIMEQIGKLPFDEVLQAMVKGMR